MKKNKTWDVVISGGGTAGHLMPGISVAKALVKQGVVRGPEKVHFVGSRREIERKLVSAAGFTITRMPGEGIRRNWSLKNFGAIYGLLVAVNKAILLLLRNRPKIVVSLGGYASAPSTVAAILLRIPLILMEQNAVPGLVNRIFARFAKANVVAFEGMGLGKSVNLGNPVREEFIALTEKIDRKGARNSLGVNEEILILAFGGSLGSQQINKAVKEFVESWDSERLIVHHVIGERDFKDETFRASHPKPQIDYRPVEYEDEMPKMMTCADLVICRAGATTVAEIALVGLPAIFIPLPNAPGDHQTVNAQALCTSGAAVLLSDNELNGVRLSEEIDRLVSDKQKLLAMANLAKDLGRPESASDIANLVRDFCNGK
ncbi:MAG: UDP-N-acetylglucosamine--N-acetylmuramyl-(pentapeptide) pyrophosphoryl-undecaprenol N-acetylglucosamine transferase [Acidimicrobiales bacterium AG-410-I20]|nr:MAG: UDP-N-acetylglucosamine--N-acetylmuramyl-(pentapeptide) pyrophosphoryl-undecaprenol N-acetylglucosamine transferase [Acidimicrobiales bacterium AG-410-I20]